jgi:hypothetical protein
MSGLNADLKIPGPMIGIALAGLVSMVVAVLWGIANGPLSTEFPAIVGMAWGLVTIIDLYVGLAMIAAWIWWREESAGVALGWALALATCGNIATCLYIILAIRNSRGNVHIFWSGSRQAANEQGQAEVVAARDTNA